MRTPQLLFLSMTPLFMLACTTPLEHTVRTDLPEEAIWQTWTDVEQWPTWDTELEYARLDGAFEDYATGALKAKGNPEASFTLSRVEPRRGYAVHIKLPAARLELRRHLEAVPNSAGQIDVTHEVAFAGPMGWFFALLLKRKYRRALPEVMDKLIAQSGGQP